MDDMTIGDVQTDKPSAHPALARKAAVQISPLAGAGTHLAAGELTLATTSKRALLPVMIGATLVPVWLGLLCWLFYVMMF